MIKFDVTNRFTGKVQFTAEIDCDESTSRRIKLGLAVKWALKTRADLRGAYLRGADLRGADLGGAYLRDAYLRDADLGGADLRGADLGGAYLRGAYLKDAGLRDADLRGADGVSDFVKSLHLEEWPITYTADRMQIGCEQHSLDEWRGFDDRRIADMDGKRALKFWRKYKDHIFATIELCPAKPTKDVAEAAA